MPLKPLRQRRLDYVKSTRVDTPEGPVYHVDLAERPGAEKISWLEKATQRDFAIGCSVGSLAAIACAGLALPITVPGLLVLGCAIIGGISDYVRNTHEMEKGVDIGPPQRFNRDAIKSAFSWGFLAKLATVAIGVGLAMAGVPLFGVDAAWSAAAGSGVLSQIGAVAAAIPFPVGMGAFVLGAGYGTVKGSEIGYERMEREYKAAKIKFERPELGVAVELEPSVSLQEATINVLSSAATGGLAADAVNAIQSAKGEKDTGGEQKGWHQEKVTPRFSFVQAEEQRRSTQPEKVANNIVSFTRSEEQRRAAHAETALQV